MKLPQSHPDEAAEVPDVGCVRLGKLTPKKDKRTFKFGALLPSPTALPKAKGHVKRSHLVPSWPMYGNDTLGDCTCAAVGHIEQLVSVAGGAAETPPDQAVLDLYWATGSADDGRYCLDVLNYWRNVGFGPDREKILAYALVDHRKSQQVKLAIDWFGGLYLGVALPISAQRQTTWKVVRGADAAPGSWGGHAIPVFDYDSTGVYCVTWGRVMKMSWGFFDRYTDESYAIIAPDWIESGASPKDAGGFKLDKLQQMLDGLKAA